MSTFPQLPLTRSLNELLFLEAPSSMWCLNLLRPVDHVAPPPLSVFHQQRPKRPCDVSSALWKMWACRPLSLLDDSRTLSADENDFSMLFYGLPVGLTLGIFRHVGELWFGSNSLWSLYFSRATNYLHMRGWMGPHQHRLHWLHRWNAFIFIKLLFHFDFQFLIMSFYKLGIMLRYTFSGVWWDL